MAESFGLPLRDPDGVAGPAYVRLPAILALFFALDVVPRGVWRARGGRRSLALVRDVVAERWPRRRLVLAVVGLVSFYLTYVSYRNLKSFLPFVREGTEDGALLVLDRAMGFGRDPATLLHDLLGTGIAAHVLSPVYLFFLLFVPISLGAALVWSKDIARGYWYVTALGANWLLGTLSYYALPSLGPVYVRPELFGALPETGTSRLQDSLLEHRLEALAGPFFTNEASGIAGFASLHVAIVFSAALIAHLLGLARLVRWSMWLFLLLTVLATIYFGWHYLIDDVAGIAIGALAVWIGAVATGHELRGGRAHRVPRAHAEPAVAADR
jgi:membrane-associated phospholipid phosphatase